MAFRTSSCRLGGESASSALGSRFDQSDSAVAVYSESVPAVDPRSSARVHVHALAPAGAVGRAERPEWHRRVREPFSAAAAAGGGPGAGELLHRRNDETSLRGSSSASGSRIKSEALAREKEAYLEARYIVCMSRWCAEDVKASYGILPGEGPSHPSWRQHRRNLRTRAEFVGRQPVATQARGSSVSTGSARAGRYSLTLRRELRKPGASGRGHRHRPRGLPSFRAHPAVRAVGFIDKSTRPFPAFVELVRSFHFGCLLSHAET